MNLRDRITASVNDIKAKGQRLVQLNVELLQAELKKKAAQYGAGVGLLVGAAFVSLYALGFALATITVALALVLPLWLALLIVTLALFLLVVILALVGRSRLRVASQTPGPQRAMDEAKVTADMVKENVRLTTEHLKAKATPKPKPKQPAPAPGWTPPVASTVTPTPTAPPPEAAETPETPKDEAT